MFSMFDNHCTGTTEKNFIFCASTFLVLLTVAGIAVYHYLNKSNIKTDDTNTPGYQLVKCLYEFEDVSELDSERDGQLKELVTDNVYDELTFDNEGRMLRTYLKLKSEPVKVNIVRDANGLVLYRLETEKISMDRLFALVYETNSDGRISYVREMECIDFVTTID